MYQKIAEILKNQTITNQFDFSPVYLDKDGTSHNYNLVTTSFFLNIVGHLFEDNQIKVSSAETAFSELVNTFNLWKTSRSDAYAVRCWGLAQKYNPIDNYDGIETLKTQTKDTHGHTITRTHADTQTQTLNNSDTRTHADTQTQTLNNSDTRTHADTQTQTLDHSDTTTHDDTETRTHNNTDTDALTFTARTHTSAASTYGFNSTVATPKDSTQDTDAGTETHTIQHTGTIADAHTGTITDAHSGTIADAHTGTITDAHSGTITDAHTGTTTDANSGIDQQDFESTLTKHGNLGVTTTAQMLDGEYHLLIHDLALQFIFEFIDRFTFVCESFDF